MFSIYHLKKLYTYLFRLYQYKLYKSIFKKYKKKELGEALFSVKLTSVVNLTIMDIKSIRSKGVLGIEILIKVIRGITMY